MERVYVLGGKRTAFARAGTNHANSSVLEMINAAAKGLVETYKLQGKQAGEVTVGAVIAHSAVWNLAREVVFASGLHPNTPGSNLSRACATGLDGLINVHNRIALGNISWGIAGGGDSMSMVPLFLSNRLTKAIMDSRAGKTTMARLKPFLKMGMKDLKPGAPAITESITGLTMGQSCELMAKEWKISRSAQDELALASHVNAAKALNENFFAEDIVSFNGLQKDNCVRGDTSLEKLAKLKTSFDRSEKGTLTAGNSSALTDGASVVLVGNEKAAKELGRDASVFIRDYEIAAIDLHKEGLLMAPAYAVARMLERQKLKLQDFDFYEIHEAFAAQVLCTLAAWESDKFCKERLNLSAALGRIDRTKLNVKGGSVAVGHPFAATGGRIVMSLANILKDKPSGTRGLVSICTGGGMGTVAILEKA